MYLQESSRRIIGWNAADSVIIAAALIIAAVAIISAPADIGDIGNSRFDVVLKC